jgi:VWFA-related protein
MAMAVAFLAWQQAAPAQTAGPVDVPSRPSGETPLFTSDTDYVTVDIAVVNDLGELIPGIPQENFQILEDGVPQKIVSFGRGEGEATVCVLIEFSSLIQPLWTESWQQTLTAAYGFVETLRPEDYVAVVSYDRRTNILTDFTQDRLETRAALDSLKIATYSESSLFDALGRTIERMKDIEGRKAILVIGTGRDTSSEYNLEETLEAVQEGGVTVHAISLTKLPHTYVDDFGMMSSISRTDFVRADNQLRTFSRESGGRPFFPQRIDEFSGIFEKLNDVLRNQYTAVYALNNTGRNGEYREIEVRLVDAEGGELRITDEKGKRVAYQVVHKEGYVVPREVE